MEGGSESWGSVVWAVGRETLSEVSIQETIQLKGIELVEVESHSSQRLVTKRQSNRETLLASFYVPVSHHFNFIATQEKLKYSCTQIGAIALIFT